jgi:hypothetical protein
MKTSVTLFLLAAGLALGIASNPVNGADNLEKSSSSSPAARTLHPHEVFNLDIIGGVFEPKPGVRQKASIGHLVEFIREIMPGLNIILSPGTSEIMIQELRLRSVGVREFLQSLMVATDGRVQWRQLDSAPYGTPAYSLMSRPAREQATEIEVFNLSPYINRVLGAGIPPRSSPVGARGGQADSKQPGARQSVTDDQLQTYSAWRAAGSKPDQDELDKLLDQILSITHETVTFANDSELDRRMDWRFHKEARLLVVRGTPKAIEVVRKVVNALNEKETSVRRDLLPDMNP